MAPEKSVKKKKVSLEKELTLWEASMKSETVPSSFVCYNLAEREFGITFKVIVLFCKIIKPRSRLVVQGTCQKSKNHKLDSSY